MSEDKSGKHRWTDPVVLVPIITAVIAAILGPTYYYYFLIPKPTEEPTPTTPTEPTPTTPTEPTPTTGPNSRPKAFDMSVNTKDNTPVGIVLNGTDKDEQDALNFTLETKPLYGEISSFSPRGSVQYRPFLLGEVSGKGNNQTLSDVGSDAFTFTVSDNRGAVSAPAKVTIISIPNEPTPTPTPEPTPTPTDGLRGILRGLDGDVIPLSPDDSSEPGGIQLPPESLVEKFVSPDSFIVETDKDSYEFGDNVTVSGIVRKPITGNVTITVNDPDGKPFVSKGFGMLDQVHWGEDVIPNEQGQFSYRFRLVDANQEDGIQGTYRVQAEYGDETKEVEFTVE